MQNMHVMRLLDCIRTTDWEYDQKQNLFNVGSCIISQKWLICEEYMTTKNHRRKMFPAMECESVETSGFLYHKYD